MSESKAYPENLNLLIQTLSNLPGVGQKSAERMALSLLEWDEKSLQEMGNSITSIRERIKLCSQCGYFTEEERCLFCDDPSRDCSIICVVEEPTQVPIIESSSTFNGLYHVLGGRIVPLEGTRPEDLNIQSLHERLQNNQVNELIIATGSDMEGEATATYLTETFSQYVPEISRIATGVPVGADLNYADSATIATAIQARTKKT